LDTTNGETLASKDLRKLKVNDAEKELLNIWELILIEARKTKNYNPKMTYGIYQIFAELNTTTIDEITRENVPDYRELNSYLKSLKQKLKDYYNMEIVPVLFKYEFLK
ncbi:MAG: hypothetical protein SPJ61_02440, partial [Eubacteriales bacterium]|nr:hypothetical protein [Eubacteriales bacterium]